MKYRNVAIDTETLDTETTAKILSIGIVPFNWGEQVSFEELCNRPSSKYIKIDMNSYLVEDGVFTTNASTESWWSEQGEEARHVLEPDLSDLPIRDALHSLKQHLSDYVEPLKKDQGQVFCRGYDFDGGILNNAFEQCGIAKPWGYNRFRCVRTVIDTLAGTRNGYVKESDPDGFIHHHALHDAAKDTLSMITLEMGRR
ncbi:3'-5' exonuclease [Vibrio algicola]|uniref:3'-5' exoribonuclease Rv2179c-like domain-containing protein n=1 Tax=Vibrio algicola TaxID=2662262 RepID=A0A5Q0TIC8_9VIBR|nr:3'-5' exonuclease [Vibrio algicola]